MYILQNGLTKYFREIDINQKVVLVDNAARSMLFKNNADAIKFQNVLNKLYNINCVIIEL